MNRDGHNNINWFTGTEVEHTPAFSKKTLFVVGEQEVDTIERLAREHKTPHIFLGANHSFNATITSPYWDKTITALLDRGFLVTLDYQAHEHEFVLKMLNTGIWQSKQFIPLLGVRIPKLQTSSPNLTIKIDDIDFNATNPGVWCMHFNEITDSNRFTDWKDYETDVILKNEQSALFIPHKVDVVDNLSDMNEKIEYRVAKKPDRTINLVEIKELIENQQVSETTIDNEDKNNTSLGLDTESKSKLKSELDEKEEEKQYASITDAETAAEAYAAGATKDPLGKTAQKKIKVTKT